MAEIPLVAAPRTDRGSAPARRLRTAGRIPGVVYGHSVAPVAIDVDARELRAGLSSEAGANALFDLNIGGDHQLAIARELQRHPVRQSISHVDFQVVRRDEIVSADVPVVVVGEAVLVNRGDGSIEHLLQQVHVRAIPTAIPTSFEISIDALEIGQSIRIGDLVVADGVTIEGDPETAIVIAHPPRSAAAGDEGGEGEAAAGETAAAADDSASS